LYTANIKTRDHAQHQQKDSSGSFQLANHDLSGSGDSPANHQYHDDDTYDVQSEPDEEESNPNIESNSETEEENESEDADTESQNIPWERLDDGEYSRLIA